MQICRVFRASFALVVIATAFGASPALTAEFRFEERARPHVPDQSAARGPVAHQWQPDLEDPLGLNRHMRNRDLYAIVPPHRQLDLEDPSGLNRHMWNPDLSAIIPPHRQPDLQDPLGLNRHVWNPDLYAIIPPHQQPDLQDPLGLNKHVWNPDLSAIIPSHRQLNLGDPLGLNRHQWTMESRPDPLADADTLGIPRRRLEVEAGAGRIFYKIDTASYPVDPTKMREMQETVSAGLASGDGFIVERLEPTSAEASPAFLLYTGQGAPQEFVGVESLGQLAAMASSASLGLPAGNSNLTFVGSGNPIDFDAARLTIAMQSQPDTVPVADKRITFRTPSRLERFAVPGARSLSLEDTHVAFRDGRWEATQRFGAAIIRAIAATKELAIQALSAIRITIAGTTYVTEDDPPRIDHARVNRLSAEDQGKIIDAAVTDARAAYQSLRGYQSVPTSSHLSVDIHVDFNNETKSVRFAGEFLSPAIELATKD